MRDSNEAKEVKKRRPKRQDQDEKGEEDAVLCQIYCVAQLGILGWQTAAIKWYKDRAASRLLPAYAGTYDTYDQRFPGYYERYYESAEEQFYTGPSAESIILSRLGQVEALRVLIKETQGKRT